MEKQNDMQFQAINLAIDEITLSGNILTWLEAE